MARDFDTAFSVIQHALEAFDADVGRVRTAHAESEESLACVEYELAQMKKLIAENALVPGPPPAVEPSGIEVAGEHVGGGLRPRLVRAA